MNGIDLRDLVVGAKTVPENNRSDAIVIKERDEPQRKREEDFLTIFMLE